MLGWDYFPLRSGRLREIVGLLKTSEEVGLGFQQVTLLFSQRFMHRYFCLYPLAGRSLLILLHSLLVGIGILIDRTGLLCWRGVCDVEER